MNDTPTEREVESTWTRLRRRKVVQWGVVYVAAAWGFLQGLEYVSEAFHWPDQLRQIALIALLIGLPVVLVLAWYHGDRGQQRITTPEFAILTLLLLLGGGAFWYYQRASEGGKDAAVTATTARQDGSPEMRAVQLAVLPFQMAHADPVSDYLALALPDAITTRLANLHTLRIRPTVTVLPSARNETDPQRLGRALSVDHVLTGVLHTTGDEMRVNLQLVRVNDGVPVWGESIQLPGGELLPFRDHPFVENIINALQLQITAMERERLFSGRQPDAHAYQLHLVGRTALAQHTEQGMREAARSFQSAIDRDADFAAAHAGLARAAAEMTLHFATKPEVEEWHQRALAAAREALRLDPYSAEAHEAMTAIYRKIEFQWDLVLKHGLRALELNPSLEQPYFYIAGAYFHLGLFDDAVDVVARGIAVNPAGDLVEGKRARGWRSS